MKLRTQQPRQGITNMEAAERLGVTEGTIRGWRRKNFVALFEDGSIDPDRLAESAAKAGRSQSPIHGGRRAKRRAGTQPPGLDTGQSAIPLNTGGVTFDKVRTATELRRARQQDLDYAVDAKQLVSRVKVERALTDLGVLVREVFERIPDRLAPVLAQEADANAIRAQLMDAQNAAMREIADRAARIATELGANGPV